MHTTHRLIAAAAFAVAAPLTAQGTARLTVRVESEGGPVDRAIVHVDSAGGLTNSAGLVRLAVPAGPRVLHVNAIGYAPESLAVNLAAGRDTLIAVTMTITAAKLSGVIVTTDRGATRIEESPTRVEALAGDDVAEKTEMRPQDLRGFLTEMPGIQVQLTSAATGAGGVRIQGLKQRYSLLLADGLPLYGGTGGSGLDLMQLPPADLKQIEVVKGPASALYGASALGGTINLVSKRPAHEQDLLLHSTSSNGQNAFGWISRKLDDRWGYTTVAGAHRQELDDGDGDGWSDVASVRRGEIRPRLFYDAPNGTSLFVTAGGTYEDRTGGTMPGKTIGTGQRYADTANTRRADLGVVSHGLLRSGGLLQFRLSANRDQKDLSFGGDAEHVTRSTLFSELSHSRAIGHHDWLVGTSVQRDAAAITEAPSLDYTFTTASAFLQDSWRPSQRVSITGTARVDSHSRYGVLWSPRASVLVTLADGWTARLSGTRGAYAPTPFVEETDAVGVRHVRGFASLDAETASHTSFDINGKSGPVELNATVFHSEVAHPVVTAPLNSDPAAIALVNASGTSRTSGLELFGVYDLDPIYVTALYTYVDAREPLANGGTRVAPRTPQSGGGLDITWEQEDTWIALEAFYTGRQLLDDDPYRARSEPYTAASFLATQRIGPVKVFFNIENIGDVRQTNYDPIVLPSRAPTGRWTTNPWAPLEGRVFSLGVRLSPE
jgi:iron complex outermembrane receptor protein